MNSVENTKIALGKTLVVTNEDHRFLVLDQLRELSKESNQLNATLLLEPVGRNKAPALSMAAFCTQQLASNQDPILVITPELKVGDVIVQIDPRYYRPTEVETLLDDPAKAKAKLGWVPEMLFKNAQGNVKQQHGTRKKIIAKAARS